MTNTLPRDTYYRGYRLTIIRHGRSTECIHIRAMGSPEFLSEVPTIEKAQSVIDEWMNAR